MDNITKQNAINQAEINRNLNLISTRTETISIIVNILNSVFSVMKPSDEIIAAIQNSINSETAVTQQLFAQVEAMINSNEPSAEVMPDEISSVKPEKDSKTNES